MPNEKLEEEIQQADQHIEHVYITVARINKDFGAGPHETTPPVERTKLVLLPADPPWRNPTPEKIPVPNPGLLLYLHESPPPSVDHWLQAESIRYPRSVFLASVAI